MKCINCNINERMDGRIICKECDLILPQEKSIEPNICSNCMQAKTCSELIMDVQNIANQFLLLHQSKIAELKKKIISELNRIRPSMESNGDFSKIINNERANFDMDILNLIRDLEGAN